MASVTFAKVKPCKYLTNEANFFKQLFFGLTSKKYENYENLLLTFRHLSCLGVKIEMREKNKFQTKWSKVRLSKPAKAKLSCCFCCCCCCCCCYCVFLADPDWLEVALESEDHMCLNDVWTNVLFLIIFFQLFLSSDFLSAMFCRAPAKLGRFGLFLFLPTSFSSCQGE